MPLRLALAVLAGLLLASGPGRGAVRRAVAAVRGRGTAATTTPPAATLGGAAPLGHESTGMDVAIDLFEHRDGS